MTAGRRRYWPKGTWMKLQSAGTLRELMKQRNMSYERLSRYAGCSRGFISHLTAGRKSTCTPQLAEKIAEALDVPLALLFLDSTSLATQQTVNQQPTRQRIPA